MNKYYTQASKKRYSGSLASYRRSIASKLKSNTKFHNYCGKSKFSAELSLIRKLTMNAIRNAQTDQQTQTSMQQTQQQKMPVRRDHLLTPSARTNLRNEIGNQLSAFNKNNQLNKLKTPSSAHNPTRTKVNLMNRFDNNLNTQPRTPSMKQPSTPSSRLFNSARTMNPGTSRLPSTPSTSTSSSVQRYLPKTPTVSSIRANLASHTPKVQTISKQIDPKKLSRTVDCAKSSVRRSIRILATSSKDNPKEFYTPSSRTGTNRLNGSRYPQTEIKKVTSNGVITTRKPLASAKRRSSKFGGLDESSCLILTPKLMRQLLAQSTQLDEEITKSKEDEEPIKVHSIKPSSLIRYLFSNKFNKSGLNNQESNETETKENDGAKSLTSELNNLLNNEENKEENPKSEEKTSNDGVEVKISPPDEEAIVPVQVTAKDTKNTMILTIEIKSNENKNDEVEKSSENKDETIKLVHESQLANQSEKEPVLNEPSSLSMPEMSSELTTQQVEPNQPSVEQAQTVTSESAELMTESIKCTQTDISLDETDKGAAAEPTSDAVNEICVSENAATSDLADKVKEIELNDPKPEIDANLTKETESNHENEENLNPEPAKKGKRGGRKKKEAQVETPNKAEDAAEERVLTRAQRAKLNQKLINQ